MHRLRFFSAAYARTFKYKATKLLLGTFGVGQKLCGQPCGMSCIKHVGSPSTVDIYVTWTVTSVISDTEWETSLRSSIAPLYQTLVNTHRHLRYIRIEMRIMLTKAHVWNPIGSCDYTSSYAYAAFT